jgi:hypothetical protein
MTFFKKWPPNPVPEIGHSVRVWIAIVRAMTVTMTGILLDSLRILDVPDVGNVVARLGPVWSV